MIPIDSIFASIAREHLNIPTLATRRADSLDFHTVAIWAVKDALEAAYNAGSLSTGTHLPSKANPSKKPVSSRNKTLPLISKGTTLVRGKLFPDLWHDLPGIWRSKHVRNLVRHPRRHDPMGRLLLWRHGHIHCQWK